MGLSGTTIRPLWPIVIDSPCAGGVKGAVMRMAAVSRRPGRGRKAPLRPFRLTGVRQISRRRGRPCSGPDVCASLVGHGFAHRVIALVDVDHAAGDPRSEE